MQSTNIQYRTSKQFRCSACGGELTLINQRTRFVGCQYCGAVTDTTTEAYQVISNQGKATMRKPYSFLKLGMIGNFNTKKGSIVGRTCWTSEYKEREVEEGKVTYENGSWKFDEWLLLMEDGSYLTIIEDKDGCSISETVIPKFPNLPQGKNIQHFYSLKQVDLQEFGKNEIVYFEGESTYLIHVGAIAEFAEYKQNADTFSVEWRRDEKGKVKEVEFFREYKIPRSLLLNYFAEEPEIKALIEKRKEIALRTKYNSLLIVAAIVACFFLAIVGSSIYTEKEIFKQDFFIGNTPQETGSLQDTSYITEIRPEQLIKLEKSQMFGKFSMSIDIPDGAEASIDVQLLNSRDSVVAYFVDEFFNYTFSEQWYEEGESGVETVTEKNESFSKDFAIEKDETYKLKITVFTLKRVMAANQNLKFSIAISTGGIMYGNLIIMAVILIVMLIIYSIVGAVKMRI